MTINLKQALVLVGGVGSRLGDVTKSTPKPLLKVGEKPFVTYIVDSLFGAGITEIILLAGYKGEMFEEYCSHYPLPNGKKMKVVIESEALGTGGSVAGVYDSLDEYFLLLNGDTKVTFSLNALKECLIDRNGSCAVVLNRVLDASRYGRVDIDPDTSVVESFSEKLGDSAPGLINSGVYLLSKQMFSKRRGHFSLERELLPSIVAKKMLLGSIEEDNFFIDIGVPEDLSNAQTTIPKLFN